jgi:hypothetical protein
VNQLDTIPLATRLKELFKLINDMAYLDDNLPAGAKNSPLAPYNQEETFCCEVCANENLKQNTFFRIFWKCKCGTITTK